jgi:hypothetical protein
MGETLINYNKPLINPYYNKPLINPYHTRMFMSSFLFLLLSLIANFQDLYILGLVDFLLFLTSVNYWNYPIKGSRRNIDISMVVIFSLVHIYWTWHIVDDIREIILVCVTSIAALYFCAKLGNDHNHSSAFHTTMHVIVFGLFFYVYENLIG